MVHRRCSRISTENTVAVSARGLLTSQRGLVHLKKEADLILMGNVCFQTTVPVHEVREAPVVP